MSAIQNKSWLFTPGPITTSMATKEAMLHDWGSRDASFIQTNVRVRERLLDLVDAAQTHVCVPVQGSGTFAIEATLGTMIKKTDKALVLINGAYGKRIARILKILDRPFDVIETPEDVPNDVTLLKTKIQNDPTITHIIAVHCETTSGILNPIEEISRITANSGRKLIIDAMSSFGALPLSNNNIQFEAVVASSNKCLEGVPGLGFALIEKQALERTEGNSPSLCLDLYDQWKSMEANDQWRFTPPTHVIAALDSALDQLVNEGGRLGRQQRYQNNCTLLVKGMRALGFETLLPDNLQAPIIVTFKTPSDPDFEFEAFYSALKQLGYVIYPGKLTVVDSFRIGCIGQVGEEQILGLLDAVNILAEGYKTLKKPNKLTNKQ